MQRDILFDSLMKWPIVLGGVGPGVLRRGSRERLLRCLKTRPLRLFGW